MREVEGSWMRTKHRLFIIETLIYSKEEDKQIFSQYFDLKMKEPGIECPTTILC